MTLSQGKQSNDSKLESTTGASKEYFPCLAGLLTCFHKETSLDFSFFFSIPREYDLERDSTLYAL